VSFVDLVDLICKVVGYKGGVQFDASRPAGVPRKMIDPAFAASLGWRARTPLRGGLAATYRWYLDNIAPKQRRAGA
jgi:GDP-L-fucose synthase